MKNLVVTINGRDAVPVRALCLLAGRKRLSPDVVAGAACGGDHYDGDRHLPTYQLVDGVVHAVDPTHWALFCEAIESASLLLRGKGLSLRATRTQWFNEATMLLPGGVFVWLDEFQGWFRRTRPYRVKEGKTGLQLEQPEEGRVSLAPPISDELRACLLAGFSPTPALPTAPTPEQPARTDAEPVPEEAAGADTDLESPPVRPKRQTQADRIKACLAECERRAAEKGLVFDLQNMPGAKADLLDFLHNKDGDNLRSIKCVSSLDRYLKGVCKWSNSAHANPPAAPLYAQLFPELEWAPRAIFKKSTQQRKT